jgi:preprotein translocase subunit SecG
VGHHSQLNKEIYKMTRVTVRLAVLAFAVMLVLNAFAKPKSESITLFQDATLNGANVPAGEYVVKYDVDGSNAQVKFMKGNKEVASATGQVKTLTKKTTSSQVVVNTDGNSRSISEIDFGGKDTAISFAPSGAEAGK